MSWISFLVGTFIGFVVGVLAVKPAGSNAAGEVMDRLCRMKKGECMTFYLTAGKDRDDGDDGGDDEPAPPLPRSEAWRNN